ncbi:hypothetical protein LCGC14_2165500 [marine sediment metagenome]|uniref:Terminase large subunit gp17-like C-terminal domain-containing protein n=1 Tax=marine sediment metagenome TaxID=412755 RepID=A0A0F9EDU1_9ZZZZ
MAKPDSMLDRLERFDRWLHKRQCIIRNVDAQLQPLILNRAQRAILDRMKCQARDGRPIRLVVLKARKLGVSTFTQALYFFISAHYRNQIAFMLAHQADSTTEIFEIARLMSRRYALIRSQVNRQSLIFDKTSSRYRCQTAGAEGVGAGGTPSLLHRSEIALWRTNKTESDYTSGEAVPFAPDTIIVDESTARGRELFFNRFEAAHDEEHPYEPIFLPWYYDDGCALEGSPIRKYEMDEIALIRRAANEGIELGAQQIRWRRMKLKELGPGIFRQEYPSTPEEAVQGFTDLVLPNLRDCLIDKLPFDYVSVPWDQRVGGIDYGYHDPTVIVTSLYISQILYVIDVYRKVEGLASDHIQGVCEGHMYYCDPAALQARQELKAESRRVGIAARFNTAPRALGRREINYIDAEWEAVRQLVRDGRLKIMRGVHQQIMLEADNLVYDSKSGTPDTRRGEGWGHFDTLDALRYNVMGCVRKVVMDLVPKARRDSRRVSMRRW